MLSDAQVEEIWAASEPERMGGLAVADMVSWRLIVMLLLLLLLSIWRTDNFTDLSQQRWTGTGRQ